MRPILSRPITVDVGLQLHHLRERLTVKTPSQLPGVAFTSGGDILRGSITLGVEL